MSERQPASPGSARISADGDELAISIPIPQDQHDTAAQLAFAGRSESLEGPLRWCRFRALHSAYALRSAEADLSDVDPSWLFDPFTTTAAEYAAVARVTQGQAEAFLDRAADCFERIPRIGECLRDALITPKTFDTLRYETGLIQDPAVLADVDAAVAAWIRDEGRTSSTRAGETARRIVTRCDAEAARQRRKDQRDTKDAGVSPLGGRLSRFVITADAEDAQLSQEMVDALASGVCSNDPRTRGERRSDAATALLHRRSFSCHCGLDTCTAELSEEQIAARSARIVLHVVVRGDTLDGTDDTPAYLDGMGPISADHVREMRERCDTVRRELDIHQLMDSTARASDPYRPTSTCDTVVRALFGRCSWPGCERPAYKADLDHVCEYNHRDPSSGGATCFCNLNPKCRFHHGLKTHTDGWLDDQIIDANGEIWTEVTTPSGITVRTRAGNTWLLPEIGLIPCRHGPPNIPGDAPPDVPHLRNRSRTEAKHRYRMSMRAANRRKS